MQDYSEAEHDELYDGVLKIIKLRDLEEYNGDNFTIKELSALEGEVKKRMLRLLDKDIIDIINTNLKNSDNERDYIKYELFYLLIGLSDVDASDINDDKKEKLNNFLNKMILDRLKLLINE